MKILLVEDDISTRKLQQMILQRAGYEIVEAEDGAKALEILDQIVADMIILDILMPGLTGIEVLQRLRQDPRTKRVPVILCTSVCDHAQVQEAMSLGIFGYILKPIVARDLVQKVKLAARKAEPVLIEPAKVIYNLGLDIPGYQQVLDLMIGDALAKLKDIGTKVEQGDVHEFEHFSRDLCASAENLGAPALRSTVKDIRSAFDKAGIAQRSKYLFKIRYELERLKKVVSDLPVHKKPATTL